MLLLTRVTNDQHRINSDVVANKINHSALCDVAQLWHHNADQACDFTAINNRTCTS